MNRLSGRPVFARHSPLPTRHCPSSYKEFQMNPSDSVRPTTQTTSPEPERTASLAGQSSLATRHSPLATALTRCHHKTSSGKPCRYLARPNSRYCKRHDKSPHPEVAALSTDLAAVAQNFDSPADVKNVLLKIFHALAADLITERRAGILCYITHTILQAQRAAAYCQKLADEKAAAAGEDRADEERLPLTWNLARPEDLARMAQHDPRRALAVIRAQCETRLRNEENISSGAPST